MLLFFAWKNFLISFLIFLDFYLQVFLFVIDDVYPRKQEFAFFFVALNGLRSRDDGHPFLNILFFGVALRAEEVEIFLRSCYVAVEPEQKVRSRHVRRGVALRCVRPIEDIRRSVLGDDYVGGVEISVAKFVVFRHSVKTGVKFVTGGRVEIGV